MVNSNVAAVFADVKVIDADTHLTEPHDLWTSRAPAKWRDLVPQIHEVDGRKTWFINGDTKIGPAVPSSVILRDSNKAKGADFMNFDFNDVHASSHSVPQRLEMMDRFGIYAQIVYPNILGFGGQRASSTPESVRLIAVQLYNDAMAELQEQSRDRLFPMALLPWWNINASIEEAGRCKAMGLRGVNTNADPHNHGLPDLGQEYWHPLWEACSDMELPVNFHIGASDESLSWFGTSPWPSHNDDRKLALGSAMMYLSNAKVLANILYSGILERFPRLNFVSVESGVGWIPFFLEALDYQLGEIKPESYSLLTMKPSEYFRRQIYACFWFEHTDIVHTIQRVGENNMMFETDFPHPTCLYPDPLGYVADAFASTPRPVLAKLMGGNAARLYHIPITSP
jgi:predicted TIM-barrel fold metal-dependent hydrolase